MDFRPGDIGLFSFEVSTYHLFHLLEDKQVDKMISNFFMGGNLVSKLLSASLNNKEGRVRVESGVDLDTKGGHSLLLNTVPCQ